MRGSGRFPKPVVRPVGLARVEVTGGVGFGLEHHDGHDVGANFGIARDGSARTGEECGTRRAAAVDQVRVEEVREGWIALT